MPVFELTAGAQHERELAVRPLGGGNDVCRHEFGAAGRRREFIDENHRLTRIALLFAWIGAAASLSEPLPGDAGDRRHRLAHFVEHLARAVVVPVEPDAAPDLLDDPTIGPGFAGGVP